MKVKTLIKKLKKLPKKEQEYKVFVYGDINEKGGGSIMVGGKVIKIKE